MFIGGRAMIAKLLMPWLFVRKKLGVVPFAKVRRDGPAARPRRKARRSGRPS
jgi:hypothetical protein